MADSYSKIYFHLVFAVYKRQKLISPDFSDEIYSRIGAILKNKNMMPLAIGGYNDHIHIFFFCRPGADIPGLVKVIKMSTTKWVNSNGFTPIRFGWQNGYAIFSVSHSLSKKVIQYIDQQEHYHRCKETRFEKEYLELLEKHEVAFQEQYVFD